MNRSRKQQLLSARSQWIASAVVTVYVGVSPSRAVTPLNVIAQDLTSASSYSPAQLPTSLRDVCFVTTSTSFQPFSLNDGFWLTAGSINNLASGSINIVNTGAGVSGITLGAPIGSAGNLSSPGNTLDLIYAASNMTIRGTQANASAVGFLDLVLARDGRFDAAAGATLDVTSGVETAGHTLTFTGGGTTRIGQPIFSNGTNSLGSAGPFDPTGYGLITGSGGVTVANTGTGYVQIDGAHTYTGPDNDHARRDAAALRFDQ